MDVEKLQVVSKNEYSEVITRFLRNIDFHLPRYDYDISIQASVTEYLVQQDWPYDLKERALKVAKPMSLGVALCYPQAPKPIRIAYAVHGCYILFIDDISTQLGEAIDEFGQRLMEGRAQRSPILQSLVEFSKGQLREVIGPYAASMILKSTIDFIAGLVFERAHNGSLKPPLGATSFAPYLRLVTGSSEPYAHFVFHQTAFPEAEWLARYLPAIPDLVDFINYSNDIISFYKECVVGSEKMNYVCNTASTRGLSVNEALEVVSGQISDAMERVRKVLEGWPEMLEVVEDFFSGYVLFHLNQPRYELMGVITGFVKEGCEKSWDGLLMKV